MCCVKFVNLDSLVANLILFFFNRRNRVSLTYFLSECVPGFNQSMLSSSLLYLYYFHLSVVLHFSKDIARILGLNKNIFSLSIVLHLWKYLWENRWHAVASWTWDAQDETCGICRMAFDGCCPDCKLPGDDCPLSKQLQLVNLMMAWCTYCLVSCNNGVKDTITHFHFVLYHLAVWGACNHAFHLHCILKWVNSQTPQAHCPMCRREWQFKGSEWVRLKVNLQASKPACYETFQPL